MIVLDGQPALSAFRIERLNAALAGVAAGCSLRSARHVYAVAADAEGAVDLDRLQKILQASGPSKPAALWVVPRVGTISPWSSKATDILHDCGFAIRRVERALAVELERAPQPGSAGWQAVVGILHDPMTESILTRLAEFDRLFDVGAALPLGRIALGNDPQVALEAANRRLGLALAADEIAYLAENYAVLD
ncbi:MAG: phosphoribosylformylglycinamidine synthase, partial [Xanthomonadales bacterium]|nr:phosphoribosylformylglycinamidine synthase [Xanthomonadales bacterium]